MTVSEALGGIKIRQLKGHLHIENDDINDLTGCPSESVTFMYLNELDNIQTLKGSPKKIYRLDIMSCQNLNTLEGGPKTITYTLRISQCQQLYSLKGCPDAIPILDLSYTYITDLQSFPKHITRKLNLYKNVKRYSDSEIKRVIDVPVIEYNNL